MSHDLTDAEFVLHRMPMLRVDYVTDDGTAGRGLGFNDAWVERAAARRHSVRPCSAAPWRAERGASR